MADYQVFVVDMEGTPYGEVENATVGRVSTVLNGAGACDFTLANTDPDTDLLVFGREIQIQRDGDVVFWGPLVRADAGLHETTWQCAGLLWYFQHRFMGRADRVNQLTNGDFEAGEDDWLFTGGLGHEIDTATHIEVPTGQSLKLTGPSADHTEYAYQYWTHPDGGYPTGDYMTASAQVFIPAYPVYLGGALNDWGLMLIHWRDGHVINASTSSGQNADSGSISDATPKDQWVDPPLEVGIPSVLKDDIVEVRLFPPHGDAYFDLVGLVYMESLSFGYPLPAADVATIIDQIVRYAQDNLAGFDHGKSDLNIGTDCDPTLVYRQIAYQFEEHRNILDAVMQYVREGIVDIDVALTTTTRTFTTYAPSKGSYKADMALELDVTLADFTWLWDGDAAATSVVVLGKGDGPDRPEGMAADTGLLGGLTLEIVETAADDVTTGALDAQARTTLATASRPEILEVTTLPGVDAVAGLVVGDTVPVTIDWGWVTIDSDWRVVSKQLLPKTDQAQFTLNPAPA